MATTSKKTRQPVAPEPYADPAAVWLASLIAAQRAADEPAPEAEPDLADAVEPIGAPTADTEAAPASPDVPSDAPAGCELVWEAPAKRLVRPAGDDPWAASEIVPCELRMIADDRDFMLQYRDHGEVAWQNLTKQREPTSVGGALAYQDIRVANEDLAKLTQLPRYRPGEIRRQQRILDSMPTRVIPS